MSIAIAPVQTARQWVRVSGSGRTAGEAPAIRVGYVPDGSGARIDVEVSYALAGYWVVPDAGGLIGQVDIVGGRVLDRPGLPRVPAAVFSIALPYGARFDPDAVEVSVEEAFCATETVRLQAVPQPRLEGHPPTVQPDPAAVALDQWMPALAAEVSPAPDLEGMGRAVVRVNPLAFAPASGRLLVRARVLLRVPCSVRNHGCYTPGQLDLASPLFHGLLGSRQLAA